jgi:hypothetical protein
MPGWVISVAGTVALSTFLAHGYLRVRYRGAGPLFGPRSRFWAIAIIVAVDVVAAGVGIAAAVSSHLPHAGYLGLAVPGGMWWQKPAGQWDEARGRSPAWLTFPFRRLGAAMGEDLEAWCAVREHAVHGAPLLVADAAQYYHNQLRSRGMHHRADMVLGDWLRSIRDKIAIVRLIDLDTTPARVLAELGKSPATRGLTRYTAAELAVLARRLESEAEHELRLFLAYAYRHGHHNLLIYPSRARPPLRRPPRRLPSIP